MVLASEWKMTHAGKNSVCACDAEGEDGGGTCSLHVACVKPEVKFTDSSLILLL